MADSTFLSRALNTPLASISAPSAGISTADVYSSSPAISGNVAYKLTSMNGGETVGSSEFFHIGIQSGVDVSFSEVSDATDYRLYRTASGASDFYLVANGSGSPIRDNGDYSGGAIPTENTTNLKSRSMGTSPTKFYEVSGNYRCLVKEILVNSEEENGALFNVYFVPSGESPAYGNALLYNVSLEENEMKALSLNTVLEQGDAIYASASTIGYIVGYGVVNIKLSGIEIFDE